MNDCPSLYYAAQIDHIRTRSLYKNRVPNACFMIPCFHMANVARAHGNEPQGNTSELRATFSHWKLVFYPFVDIVPSLSVQRSLSAPVLTPFGAMYSRLVGFCLTATRYEWKRWGHSVFDALPMSNIAADRSFRSFQRTIPIWPFGVVVSKRFFICPACHQENYAVDWHFFVPSLRASVRHRLLSVSRNDNSQFRNDNSQMAGALCTVSRRTVEIDLAIESSKQIEFSEMIDYPLCSVWHLACRNVPRKQPAHAIANGLNYNLFIFGHFHCLLGAHLLYGDECICLCQPSAALISGDANICNRINKTLLRNKDGKTRCSRARQAMVKRICEAALAVVGETNCISLFTSDA